MFKRKASLFARAMAWLQFSEPEPKRPKNVDEYWIVQAAIYKFSNQTLLVLDDDDPNICRICELVRAYIALDNARNMPPISHASQTARAYGDILWKLMDTSVRRDEIAEVANYILAQFKRYDQEMGKFSTELAY